MPKRKNTPPNDSPPNLLVTRKEAEEKIGIQIKKGSDFLKIPINDEDDLERVRAERSKWSKYNTELLTRLFDNNSIADEYNYWIGFSTIPMNPNLQYKIDDFHTSVKDNLTRLEAILERLELIPEIQSLPQERSVSKTPVTKGNKIFIVHGHDESIKEATARFLEKLGLKPIILHEQPDKGRTIIEKFEDYSDVNFAVVLITPDDLGASKGQSTNLNPRARQNVILELGFFLGKLGRENVCPLYISGVEIPSDISGVLYKPIDPAGAWKLSLAKEIKESGIPVDLNKAI